MNRYLLLLFTLLLFSVAPRALAQDFPSIHYTVEDGLPSNTIYDIYRDSKGYLWIATDKGVARYNGIKFETFSTFNGLPDNEIFFFQEDHYGRIWLGTYNGELCYYQNDTFHTAANTPFLKLPVKTSFVKYINVEKDSSVTIGFFEQNIFVNALKNKCNVYKMSERSHTDVLGLYRVVNILKISNDVYEHVCANGCSLFVDTNSRVLNIQASDVHKNLLFQFSQNHQYYNNNQFIFSLDRKIIKTFPKDFLIKDNLLRIYTSNGDMYLGTNTGLVINDTLQILKDNKVAAITEDITGCYWIGTLNNGIYKLSKNFLNARLYKDVYRSKTKFTANVSGHIFFALEDNSLYAFENGAAYCLFNYPDYKKGKYADRMEGGYLIDSNYNYYNFYLGEHIVINDVLHNRKNIKHYVYNHFSSVKSLFLVNNELYFQIFRRIVKLDYKYLTAEDDVHAKKKIISDTIHDYTIFCMAKDRYNNLWYNNISDMYKVVDGKGVPQPQFNGISFKLFDFAGQDLVGYTHNNQLLICSNIDGKVRLDSVLSQNCIWDKFCKLDSNHILISTNNLYRLLTLYPAGSDRIFSISAIENPFVPLRAESICADATHCYFFKNGEITSMDIKSLMVIPPPPKLFFTFLKAGKKAYLASKEMQLPYDDARNISISFSTVSFGGKNVFYQYSVSKNDKDNWRDIKGEEINLVNPGYGNYVIKIRSKSISSEYSQPEVFILVISKPYWATWWFILLCVAGGGALVAYGIRFRIKYALNKSNKEHETEVKFMKSEYKALNALMNPHFIFNTLNNVQSLVNKNDKLAANEYLRVFADIIRQNMHNISKDVIPLQKEIDLVNNYLSLEKLRFKDLLNYRVNIDENTDLSEIMVPPLLVQPLVENSIKHGILPLQSVDGYVEINVYEKDGLLVIEVKDNGAGMMQSKGQQSPLHESFGLENIKRRINQLSIIQSKEITFAMNEINDDKGQHLWTIATITMPVSL